MEIFSLKFLMIFHFSLWRKATSWNWYFTILFLELSNRKISCSIRTNFDPDYWVGNSHFECNKFSVLFCSFIVMKSRRPTIYPKSMLSSAFNIHQRCCPIFHNTLFLAKLVVMFVSEPVQLDGFLRKYVPLWHNYVVCNWICSFMWGKFHDFGIPQGNAFQRIKAHISFNCKQTENTLGKYSVIYGDFVIKYAKWWFLHTEK